MLLELKVKDFAIIENLHIQFGPGLNILSGETGAGKSVLLKGLSLLMGEKGSSESIRTGSTNASIEGSFDVSKRPDIKQKLSELGIEADEQLLIVKRLISEDKSKVYINGSLSTLNNLRDVVSPLVEVTGHAPLIEMTGQHENKNLLSTAYHLDLLDQYCGLQNLRTKYSSLYSELAAVKAEHAKLSAAAGQKEQRLDFLTYQRDEITKLDLSPGEEVSLEHDIKKAKSATRILSFVESAESILVEDDDSACARLSTILHKAHEFQNIDSDIARHLSALEQAKALIEDSAFVLRKHVGSLDSDPQALDELENRLSQIRKLQKKYGPSIDDILAALIKIETELAHLKDSDQHLLELEKKANKLTKDLWTIASEMHERRHTGAKLLADSVNHELGDLNMKGVIFAVKAEKLTELSTSGCSSVEFQIRNSSKDPARALSKAASGGELSRILLSLKRVVGVSHLPRTYLFDEVDTGVSGPTAEKVGRKLKSIAKGQQVICITHLPQVAAFGDIHFFIQKAPHKGGVAMEVSELKSKERVNEIARLISGEKISKTSLSHAQSLINEAQAAV